MIHRTPWPRPSNRFCCGRSRWWWNYTAIGSISSLNSHHTTPYHCHCHCHCLYCVFMLCPMYLHQFHVQIQVVAQAAPSQSIHNQLAPCTLPPAFWASNNSLVDIYSGWVGWSPDRNSPAKIQNITTMWRNDEYLARIAIGGKGGRFALTN